MARVLGLISWAGYWVEPRSYENRPDPIEWMEQNETANPFILEYMLTSRGQVHKNRFYCFQGATILSLSISFLQVLSTFQSSPQNKMESKRRREILNQRIINETLIDPTAQILQGNKNRGLCSIIYFFQTLPHLSPSFLVRIDLFLFLLLPLFRASPASPFFRKPWARVRDCTLRSARRLEVLLRFSV